MFISKKTAIILFSVILGAASPALAMECPQAPIGANADGISLTKAQFENYKDLLADGTASNGMDEAIHDLKAANPKASNGDIVDVLVSAYCPTVAASHESASIMAAKMKAF